MPVLRFLLPVSALAVLTLGFALTPQHKPMPKPTKHVPFASIAPILKGCAMCHSGARPKHGLDLTSYAKLMKGDREGKVVVPAKPAASRLSKAIHRKGATPMPPMGPLSTKDIAKIDAWIQAGAKS